MSSDGDAEAVGDVAQSSEAGRAVVVGFVTLDLLFGHPDAQVVADRLKLAITAREYLTA